VAVDDVRRSSRTRLNRWRPGTVISQTRRYREIVRVFAWHGFGDVLDRLHARPSLNRWRRWRHQPTQPALTPERRLRLAFAALGPTFVKFGQALSVRSDVLPAALVHELTALQDAVPPMPLPEVVTCIEQELGVPWTRVFATVDPTPLGSASIAQVHQATLLTGEEVAIKVRRPGLAATIESDIAILDQLARLLVRRLPDAALYDPPALVAQFARTIRLEQDLAREGRIIERFAENCAGDDRFVFPRVHWPHTSAGLLVLERIDGVRLGDIIENKPPGFDLELIARHGADALLKQVLVDGLFHADPHPGNILVKPGNIVCLLDFGIVGHLDRRTRDKVATLLRACGRRDSVLAARALGAIVDPLEAIDYPLLEQDVADILESYVGARLGDIPLVEVWSRIADLIAQHRLRLPPNLTLLVKALVTIEGVGRSLDQSFRMFEHAAPFVERLIERRLAPRELAHRAARTSEELASTLSTLPEDVMDLLSRLRSGRLNVQISHPESHELAEAMLVAASRFGQALLGAAALIGIAVMMRGTSVGNVWIGAVVTMVGVWLALVFGLTRIKANLHRQ
jgi:ubiquinone biosynthesis protein